MFRETEPENRLREVSEREFLLSSFSKPIDISGWNIHMPNNPNKRCNIPLSESPQKLPKLNSFKKTLRDSISLNKHKKNEKSLSLSSPYDFHSPNIIKIFYSNNSTKQRANRSFNNEGNCPSHGLREEIKAFLKYPYYPKRDISPYRFQITKAMNTSKTIDELLKFTKLPATKLLKSSQTGTDSSISPLREFRIPGNIHKLL